MVEAAKDEVKDMICLGILEPSESPYCSPISYDMKVVTKNKA